MGDDWDGYCAICISRDHCGDLRIGSGEDRAQLQRVRLCTPCFAFVAETLTAAVERPSGQAHDLHVPGRTAASNHGCDVCHAGVTEMLSVQLDPADDASTSAALVHLRDGLRPHQLCEGCLVWLRDVLDQESASRWSNRRSDHEPGDGTRTNLQYRAVAHGLAPKDEQLLRESVTNLGYAIAEGAGGEQEELVYFVAAGPGREAAHFTDALPVTERVRVIVVATADTLADASEALRLGATDLLAAPLSRQQITGAFDRLADPFAVSGRHEASGLPSYWLRARFGLPAHLVAVTPPPGTQSLDVFLVLRRFLRGYDRIGMANDGSLPIIAYCSDEHIDGVVRRMAMLLGREYSVELRGRAAPEDVHPATPMVSSRRPLLSKAFFGRASLRVVK